jgi:excinuclease ABC subunit A
LGANSQPIEKIFRVNAPNDGAYLAHNLGTISLRGVRTHNLKNIDLDIPRNQLVVITGLSGSGKSSLAFDTLYAEGQRRYVESLSAYARQFLQRMDKPDVDLIEGLSPAIAIEQKAASHNPRSTVGTVTEIHDYLRLLFARAGTPHCPEHEIALRAFSVAQMVDAVLGMPQETKIMILAPIIRGRKGEFEEVLRDMQSQGFVRFRIDGRIVDVSELQTLKKNEKHDLDVVVDRLKVRDDIKQRLAESLETALRLADGRVTVKEMDSDQEQTFNAKFACPVCNFSLAELEPRLFSFNSPQGACPECEGLGIEETFEVSRVVSFPSISLASGAIKGWDRRNQAFFSMLESLAAHYGFDVEAPFEQLSEQIQHIILFGSGDEAIAFNYSSRDTSSTTGGTPTRKSIKKHPFEGIIPNMARRFKESDSTIVKEELARFRGLRACQSCLGTRLKKEARFVKLGEADQMRTIHEINHMTLGHSWRYFQTLKLQGAKAEIAGKVVNEIVSRLRFLNDVGLNYLSLARSAETLSGGEAQRIRLASQIGSGLTGVMYVLDEPSIGLHQRDNDRLIGTLEHLRDIGNSVIVVEHDEDMILAANYCVDMGPGAGVHGGQVMAQGTPEQIQNNPNSLTGRYLSRSLRIEVPKKRRAWLEKQKGAAAPKVSEKKAQAHKKSSSAKMQTSAFANPFASLCAPSEAPTREVQSLKIFGAKGNNLKGVDVEFPVGLFTCVTGVSGSGKSTLVNDTLYTAAAAAIHHAHAEPAPHTDITGLEHFDKVINVDQSPIGRTPRSNPATYTGLFTPIRELLAEVPIARERGYEAGRFSFNVAGGRCEACQGDGVVKVEMHFLPDVYVACDVCKGKRYNRETLEVQYKGKNIAQILELTVEDAFHFFKAVPVLARKLQTLMDVGLSYLRLGQAATTLSGGEAQRVKLALELSKRDTGRTLYILDEPTTGLHFADIDLLLKVLHQLVDVGNTVVVIEHNLDVIKTADWVIDMGPEGGQGGGTVVAAGTPEHIASQSGGFTAKYLKKLLP